MKYLKNSVALLLLLSGLFCLTGCKENTKDKEETQYSITTQKLVDLVEKDSRIKMLLTEAIEKGKEINPDKSTNPAQSLEEYYDFTVRRQPCHGMSSSVPDSPASSGGCIRRCVIVISSTACRWSRWKTKRFSQIRCNMWNLTAVG